MKKILVHSVVALFCLSGCGDSFLDLKPTNQILESEYYHTEDEIMQALVAAYQPLQWQDCSFSNQHHSFAMVSDVMGGDIRAGGGGTSDFPHFHLMREFKATPEIVCNSLWRVLYSGVNRANIAIDKVSGVSDLSQDKAGRIKSEAMTLRAFYYYWLWKLWGNIPYYEKNLDASPYVATQLKANEVYDKIIGDLDTVLESNHLPNSVGEDLLGRITRPMVQMLKASAVLYQNDESRYQSALSDMREIINSGRFDLADDFGGIWEETGEWCKESIWEINYIETGSRGWEPNILVVGGTVYPQTIGINGLRGSKYYQDGWGFGPVEPSLYNAYEEGDIRRDGGILSWEVYHQKDPEATYDPRYDNTGFFNLKYMPRLGSNDQNTGDKIVNHNNNFRVFRYAETLMNAAELLVRTGGDLGEGKRYLSQIRDRAFAHQGNHEIEPTLDNILNERRLEFALEGHRFWDLVRFGKAETVLGPKGYAPNKKYLPIPAAEIDKSMGTLKQNPY